MSLTKKLYKLHSVSFCRFKSFLEVKKVFLINNIEQENKETNIFDRKINE